jgi:DNA polymerase II
MAAIEGWLLDLYPAAGGLRLWLMGRGGERRALQQRLPVTFYAAGPAARLRAAWRCLDQFDPLPGRARVLRRDIMSPAPQKTPAQDLTCTCSTPQVGCRCQREAGGVQRPVLAVTCRGPAEAARSARRLANMLPDLDYYDVDLPAALQHAAAFGSFPLCRCRVEYDAETGMAADFETLDTPWDLDPPDPPLRIMELNPQDATQECGSITSLEVVWRIYNSHKRSRRWRFQPQQPRPMLVNLAALLRQYDPDLILTNWGDSWLLDYLSALAQRWGVRLPLNRDDTRQPGFRRARSYHTYGQVMHRHRQVHLYGRIHIDRQNAMLYHDYELAGAFEMSRVSAMPLQEAARRSPGSGISAMQMVVALRDGILTPWRKASPERSRSAWQHLHRDQGGMVYQPIIGLHPNVAEIDFTSMYPAIMVHANLSPETSGAPDEPPGLVPRTLAPLLAKRVALKQRLAVLRPGAAAQRANDKARAAAHKWLLVTCFGYLGYRNARFGRIEAHEAVTAYGREALLRTKEAAEDFGYRVLHMYVDGLWLQRPDGAPITPADMAPLLDEVVERTGLPLSLEGIYRWVAFLSSRADQRIPVPNRYFGVFSDGSLKLRGIELRRRDTPPWVAGVQLEILEALAAVSDTARLPQALPGVIDLLRARLDDLRGGRVPPEMLVVCQKISRGAADYKGQAAAGRAAAQLAAAGMERRPGEIVSYVITRGAPGVHAWDLPDPPDPRSVDVARYTELLLRAAHSVLAPFGLSQDDLRRAARGRDWQVLALPRLALSLYNPRRP